jgi:hypothetical protein
MLTGCRALVEPQLRSRHKPFEVILRNRTFAILTEHSFVDGFLVAIRILPAGRCDSSGKGKPSSHNIQPPPCAPGDVQPVRALAMQSVFHLSRLAKVKSTLSLPSPIQVVRDYCLRRKCAQIGGWQRSNDPAISTLQNWRLCIYASQLV